jgi:hypothetical protein
MPKKRNHICYMVQVIQKELFPPGSEATSSDKSRGATVRRMSAFLPCASALLEAFPNWERPASCQYRRQLLVKDRVNTFLRRLHGLSTTFKGLLGVFRSEHLQ